MTVFTIGYEGLDIGAFMSLLAEHGIETVVDIRELPLSRKPGFSKKALARPEPFWPRVRPHGRAGLPEAGA